MRSVFAVNTEKGKQRLDANSKADDSPDINYLKEFDTCAHNMTANKILNLKISICTVEVEHPAVFVNQSWKMD